VSLKQRITDEYYMRMALSLALRGTGRTSPNPMVGCVIVRDGKVLAEGYHSCCGEDHAERAALGKTGDASGSTLYVNLEPCSHFGRTPPCAPLIVERGVSRVVAGMEDPDIRVRGRGTAILRSGGVDLSIGILEKECRWLNRGFIRRVTLGRPWVTVKGAISLDGGMALRSGESKWITGPDAREAAHLFRSRHDAILVGCGTILSDDPELTVRSTCGESPLRIVLDSNLSIPFGAKAAGKGTTVFAALDVDEEKRKQTESLGMDVIQVPRAERGLSIPCVLSALAERGICSVLVEGGPSVIASFFREQAVDSVSLFVSPRIMGMNRPFSGPLSFASMEETIMLKECSVRQIGRDFLVEGVPECSPAL
jgi:diaminohydroxyphosphoribosylaminopyrimidine deaminase/5-amino-6-(5-phosphoribosylamino)uracil reductase